MSWFQSLASVLWLFTSRTIISEFSPLSLFQRHLCLWAAAGVVAVSSPGLSRVNRGTIKGRSLVIRWVAEQPKVSTSIRKEKTGEPVQIIQC